MSHRGNRHTTKIKWEGKASINNTEKQPQRLLLSKCHSSHLLWVFPVSCPPPFPDVCSLSSGTLSLQPLGFHYVLGLATAKGQDSKTAPRGPLQVLTFPHGAEVWSGLTKVGRVQGHGDVPSQCVMGGISCSGKAKRPRPVSLAQHSHVWRDNPLAGKPFACSQ